MKTSKILRDIGKPIHYYPKIAQFLGGACNAIFLSYFIYWEGKQEDPNGWIYKRLADIESETGLGRYEIERARKMLEEMQVLKMKVAGHPKKTYYLFDWNTFDEKFDLYLTSNVTAKAKIIKATPEEEPIKKENILGLMKDLFDKYYNDTNPAIPYIWSKNQNGGPDWKNLKEIKIKIEEAVKIKNQGQDYILLDKILEAFEFILKYMPDYHKKRNFTPALLNSNFNKILLDIKDQHSKQNKYHEQNSTNNKNEGRYQFANDTE